LKCAGSFFCGWQQRETTVRSEAYGGESGASLKTHARISVLCATGAAALCAGAAPLFLSAFSPFDVFTLTAWACLPILAVSAPLYVLLYRKWRTWRGLATPVLLPLAVLACLALLDPMVERAPLYVGAWLLAGGCLGLALTAVVLFLGQFILDLGGAAACAARRQSPPPIRPERRTRLQRGALLLASGCVSLWGLEQGIRFLLPPVNVNQGLTLTPYLRVRVRSNLRGVASHSWYTTNQWGLRGPPPLPPRAWERSATFVAVGGSTTNCFPIDDAKVWTQVLADRLTEAGVADVWVGNAGADAQSTHGHLVVVRRLFPRIRPKHAVFLVGFNDLLWGLVSGGGRALQAAVERRVVPDTVFQRAARRGRVLFLLAGLKRRFVDGFQVTKLQGHRPFTPQTLRRLGKDKEILPEGDVRQWMPAVRDFRDNVRELIRICRRLECEPIFVTQPLLPADDEYWRQFEAARFRVGPRDCVMSEAAFARCLGVFNAELKEVCRQSDARCFDLAALVPHEWDYFYDNCHFTEAACALVGDSLGEYVLREVLPAGGGPDGGP